MPLLSLGEEGGLVVNVSDRATHEHWTSDPLHAAAKAALESLTISGAKALAKNGQRVRVNAVVPGTILPPDDWTPERIEREWAAGALSSPDALIAALRALAGDASRTGEIVRLSDTERAPVDRSP